MSLLVWKIEPSRTSSSRSSRALTRLPLCAIAIWPCAQSIRIGCAFCEPALAGRRVARVADRAGGRAGLRASRSLKASATWPIARDTRMLLAVGGGDAGALLPAVLQRVEAEVGEVRRLGVAEDAEDAALVLELVEHVVSSAAVDRRFLRMPAAAKCRSSARRPDRFSASRTVAIDRRLRRRR